MTRRGLKMDHHGLYPHKSPETIRYESRSVPSQLAPAKCDGALQQIRPTSFRIYSGNPDIDRLPAAHGCTAVQPGVRLFAQIRQCFACLRKAPPVGFEPTHTAPEGIPLRPVYRPKRVLHRTRGTPLRGRLDGARRPTISNQALESVRCRSSGGGRVGL